MRRHALLAAPVLLAALLLQTAPAHAQSDESVEATAEAMHRYFNREKGGGIALIGFGGASMATGGILLLQESDTLKGISYPLLGLGAITLGVGLVLYLRTDGQVAALEEQLEDDPAAFKKAETERVERVLWGFDLVKSVEVAALLGGLTLAVVGKADENDLLRGVGLGLMGEAAGLLIIDVIGARRAEAWLQVLNDFKVDARGEPEQGDASGAVIGLRLGF